MMARQLNKKPVANIMSLSFILTLAEILNWEIYSLMD